MPLKSICPPLLCHSVTFRLSAVRARDVAVGPHVSGRPPLLHHIRPPACFPITGCAKQPQAGGAPTLRGWRQRTSGLERRPPRTEEAATSSGAPLPARRRPTMGKAVFRPKHAATSRYASQPSRRQSFLLSACRRQPFAPCKAAAVLRSWPAAPSSPASHGRRALFKPPKSPPRRPHSLVHPLLKLRPPEHRQGEQAATSQRPVRACDHGHR